MKDPRVDHTSDERATGEGFWVYLKPEFINDHMECGLIHEWTFADIRWQMNKTVRRRRAEEMEM